MLAIHERVMFQGHPDVAENCYNLALSMEAQNKAADALPFARRAMAIWEKSGGRNLQFAKDAQTLIARLEKK